MATETRPDPRRSARKSVKMAVVLLVETDSERTEHEGMASDFSQHGLRVQASTALTPGQVVEIIPSEGPEHAVRCHVVWAGKVGSDREGEAGLEFLNPNPTFV